MGAVEPGGRGNPFESLLGDLMNMLGNSPSDQWDVARSFGLNVATGGTPEPNVDPVQRIRLEELARIAELHVTEATGMSLTPDGRRVMCIPVGPAEWTVRALEAWRPILDPLVAPPAPAAPETPVHDIDDEPGDLGAMIGQWSTTIGPMLVSLQLGSAVGHLSRRALGQYMLPLPWPDNDQLVIVTTNVATFAEDWSLPNEEALLWICARELAMHAVITRPHVRQRLRELLAAVIESATAATTTVIDRLGEMGPAAADPETLQELLTDPTALLGEVMNAQTQPAASRLAAVVSVVDAYADHIADHVGTALTGSHQQLAEAWYRRRVERDRNEESGRALFGLNLETHQIDRGRSFVAGVRERAGDDALVRLWSAARMLPTPAEVEAPGLWLERISLPDEGSPDGAPDD